MITVFNKLNYLRSNRITQVKLPISAVAQELSAALLIAADCNKRQELGELLLDELCDLAQITIVSLTVNDSNQQHRRRNGRIIMKRFGLYKVREKIIRIENRTAARGQIISPKSFLDTLLHEWLHHYDFQKLKLNSIHSRGFYNRFNDLKEKLQIPKMSR
ncbi:MAG: hypothetical protein WC668_04560 [Patescibacteria group bacterium]|jgi:hypothetical protein